jgi:hypothetical protein
VDHLTSSQSHDRLAHICVKIDLDKKLIPKFTMSALALVLNLEYEGLHVVCGKYGHKVGICHDNKLFDMNKETNKIPNYDLVRVFFHLKRWSLQQEMQVCVRFRYRKCNNR